MFQRVLPIVLMASLVAPIAAQTPAGWKVHIDRSQNAQDPTTSRASCSWRWARASMCPEDRRAPTGIPSNTATGNFTAKGTFTLVKPSNHTNYYGLVFAGNALDGPAQTYTYFVIAGTARS